MDGFDEAETNEGDVSESATSLTTEQSDQKQHFSYREAVSTKKSTKWKCVQTLVADM